jgi:protein-arginine kinase activator protein McsA
MKLDQFYCVKCREKVIVAHKDIKAKVSNKTKRNMLVSICNVCGTKLNKFVNEETLHEFKVKKSVKKAAKKSAKKSVKKSAKKSAKKSH